MAAKKLNKNSNYKIPYSGKKRNSVQRIIRTSVKNHESPQIIYDKLKKSGLGYRKQNVLADIRLKYATLNAKSPAARKQSENWFINVFEKMRIENKWNSAETKRQYEMAVNQSYKTITDSATGKRFRQLYKIQFKRPPKNDKDNFD